MRPSPLPLPTHQPLFFFFLFLSLSYFHITLIFPSLPLSSLSCVRACVRVCVCVRACVCGWVGVGVGVGVFVKGVWRKCSLSWLYESTNIINKTCWKTKNKQKLITKTTCWSKTRWNSTRGWIELKAEEKSIKKNHTFFSRPSILILNILSEATEGMNSVIESFWAQAFEREPWIHFGIFDSRGNVGNSKVNGNAVESFGKPSLVIVSNSARAQACFIIHRVGPEWKTSREHRDFENRALASYSEI